MHGRSPMNQILAWLDHLSKSSDERSALLIGAFVLILPAVVQYLGSQTGPRDHQRDRAKSRTLMLLTVAIVAVIYVGGVLIPFLNGSGTLWALIVSAAIMLAIAGLFIGLIALLTP